MSLRNLGTKTFSVVTFEFMVSNVSFESVGSNGLHSLSGIDFSRSELLQLEGLSDVTAGLVSFSGGRSASKLEPMTHLNVGSLIKEKPFS